MCPATDHRGSTMKGFAVFCEEATLTHPARGSATDHVLLAKDCGLSIKMAASGSSFRSAEGRS